jgi:hypothetical protein
VRRGSAPQGVEQETEPLPGDFRRDAEQFEDTLLGRPVVDPDGAAFGLHEKDKTADEILPVNLAKSNPDGKLVYIVTEEDGEEWVLITTRTAVEKRVDPLPPVFSP